MASSKASKPTFVAYMLKKEAINGRPYTDDEKKLAWKVWQACWSIAEIQAIRNYKKKEYDKLVERRNMKKGVTK